VVVVATPGVPVTSLVANVSLFTKPLILEDCVFAVVVP
jgi:hypothetical protein